MEFHQIIMFAVVVVIAVFFMVMYKLETSKSNMLEDLIHQYRDLLKSSFEVDKETRTILFDAMKYRVERMKEAQDPQAFAEAVLFDSWKNVKGTHKILKAFLSRLGLVSYPFEGCLSSVDEYKEEKG